jgi:hypothetical protein
MYLENIINIYREELSKLVLENNKNNKIKVVQVTIENLDFYIDIDNNVYILNGINITKVGYLRDYIIYIT